MKPIYIRLLDICIIAHPTDTAKMVSGGRDPAGMLTQQAVINVTQHTAREDSLGVREPECGVVVRTNGKNKQTRKK